MTNNCYYFTKIIYISEANEQNYKKKEESRN